MPLISTPRQQFEAQLAALVEKFNRLVQRMLDLHRQQQATSSEAACERLQREINVTDEQIDKLVYELYGLTDEEIRIVET